MARSPSNYVLILIKQESKGAKPRQKPGQLPGLFFEVSSGSFLSGFVMLRIRRKFLIEIDRAFSFFCDQTKLEPVIMLTAEIHQICFFTAAFAPAFRRYCYDVSYWCCLLVLQFCRHSFPLVSRLKALQTLRQNQLWS